MLEIPPCCVDISPLNVCGGGGRRSELIHSNYLISEDINPGTRSSQSINSRVREGNPQKVI